MLGLSNITLFLSNRCLFKNLNFKAEKGDRIGLFGPNGAGKTTLLKVITGKLKPEEGQIQFTGDVKTGYLEQEVLEVDEGLSIRELAMTAFEEANRLEQRIQQLGIEIAELDDYSSERYQSLLDELERAQNRYEYLDGDKRIAKTEDMLTGLGFQEEDLDRPMSVFSGGWRMRVLLAKLLLQKPDLLLLDEPTNHLDIDSIEWLENYLQTYPGAVILVSHDRWFLNKMVNHIAELRNQKIWMYPGNYDQFLVQREEQVALQAKQYEAQQREIAETERFIERFRYKATKAKQVQSRVKMLEKLERIDAPEQTQASVNFRFPDPPPAGKVVLQIEKLNKTYPAKDGKSEVAVFDKGQSLEIERGEKIAIVGPNGAGKSTLARIVNHAEPFDGECKDGHNVSRNYFAQHLADVLESGRTVLEEMESEARTTEQRQSIRNILGSFLFSGDDVFKPVSVLSGGERSRLALAKTLLSPANFLVLDEPTNHLDMQSKQILIQALRDYKGTVLVVSHDRYFLSEFANKFWRVENGKVTEYDGGFDYYEWKRKEQAALQDNGAAESSKVSAKVESKNVDSEQNIRGPKSKEQKRLEAQIRNQLNGELKPLKEKVKKLEKQLETMESEKAICEEKLADQDFYQSGDAPSVIKKHSDLSKQIDEVFMDWTSTVELIENKENALKKRIG